MEAAIIDFIYCDPFLKHTKICSIKWCTVVMCMLSFLLTLYYCVTQFNKQLNSSCKSWLDNIKFAWALCTSVHYLKKQKNKNTTLSEWLLLIIYCTPVLKISCSHFLSACNPAMASTFFIEGLFVILIDMDLHRWSMWLFVDVHHGTLIK